MLRLYNKHTLLRKNKKWFPKNDIILIILGISGIYTGLETIKN